MGHLVSGAAVGEQPGKQVGAGIECAAHDIVSEAVQHADGPERRVREGGRNRAGVRGRQDAIDDNIPVNRVRVVESVGNACAHRRNMLAGSVGQGQGVALADSAGDSKLAVDVQVVVSRQHQRVARAREDVDKRGADRGEAVGKHVHVAEAGGPDEHAVARLQLVHAYVRPVGQLNCRRAREAQRRRGRVGARENCGIAFLRKAIFGAKRVFGLVVRLLQGYAAVGARHVGAPDVRRHKVASNQSALVHFAIWRDAALCAAFDFKRRAARSEI